jgi:hypothetical protein
MILTITWYNLRALADATALQRERLNVEAGLKRELIQRGLPPHELEQAVKLLKLDEPPPPPPGQRRASADLVGEFVRMAVQIPRLPPEGLEEMIALVRAADAATQLNAVNVVTALAIQEVDGPVALAALRSLLRPAEKPRTDGVPLELSSHITR